MIIVKNYREFYNETRDYYVLRVYQQINCPACFSGQLRVSGRYRRYAIMDTGERITYSLRRYQCTECGRSHVELPDSIMPFMHYTSDAIQMCLAHPELSPCERSTYNRWQQREQMFRTHFRHK